MVCSRMMTRTGADSDFWPLRSIAMSLMSSTSPVFTPSGASGSKVCKGASFVPLVKGWSRSVQFAPLMAWESFTPPRPTSSVARPARRTASSARSSICSVGSLICAVGGRSGMVVMRQGVLSSLVKPVSWDFSAICQVPCAALMGISVVSRPSSSVLAAELTSSLRSGLITISLCETG